METYLLFKCKSAYIQLIEFTLHVLNIFVKDSICFNIWAIIDLYTRFYLEKRGDSGMRSVRLSLRASVHPSGPISQKTFDVVVWYYSL